MHIICTEYEATSTILVGADNFDCLSHSGTGLYRGAPERSPIGLGRQGSVAMWGLQELSNIALEKAEIEKAEIEKAEIARNIEIHPGLKAELLIVIRGFIFSWIRKLD